MGRKKNPLQSVMIRIDKDSYKSLKRFCVETDQKICDVVSGLIEDLLSTRGLKCRDTTEDKR